MQKIIDLRSDTVTTPTQKMRDAMQNAVVGDDVLGEDPTVTRLEATAAEKLGKEAGLFLVSGTMANLVAVQTLTRPGEQIIVHRNAHMFDLEAAGLASICGVQARPISAKNGVYLIEEIREQVHQASLQHAPTTLLCMENSHDLNRGFTIHPTHLNKVCKVMKEEGVKVYLDGARLFNAAVALKTKPSELAVGFDMLAFCLSKGLACPIGSVLLGSNDQINEARRIRQRLGGGWRQAGIIAAAGIVALEEMIERLAEDHENASTLARQLEGIGFNIDLRLVQTNIVFLDLAHHKIMAKVFADSLTKESVLVKPVGKHSVCFVTHKDISSTDIEAVVAIIKAFLKENKPFF